MTRSTHRPEKRPSNPLSLPDSQIVCRLAELRNELPQTTQRIERAVRDLYSDEQQERLVFHWHYKLAPSVVAKMRDSERTQDFEAVIDHFVGLGPALVSLPPADHVALFESMVDRSV